MSANGPLAGFRVLDLSRGIAGSWAGRLLAGYGADVIKVEPPETRGTLRERGPFVGDERHPERSLLFHYVNTEKRGVTLDLESPEGCERMRTLASGAHGLIEDLGPGEMDRLGLAYEALATLQPRLVLTSITPFGPTGPLSRWAAPNIVQHAIDGQIAATGNSDRPPLRLGGNLGEYMPGVMAALVTAVAMDDADRTGEGQRIDLSCAGTTFFTSTQTASFASKGEWPGRGRSNPDRGFDRVACLDGYVGVHTIGTQAMLESLSRLMEMPEMLSDPPPGDTAGRAEWGRRMAPAIRERLRERRCWDVFNDAMAARLPFGVFLSAAEVSELGPLHERDYFVDIDHPVSGRERQPGAPVVMHDSGCAYRASRPAPTLGQHNGEVFAEAQEPAGSPSGARAGKGGREGELPYSGLKVLDFTAGWAGPIAAQLMGFFGAEVIKVESMQRLDWWRTSGMASLEDHGCEKSALFNSVNRNKYEVTLDLKDARGRALFRRLADRADVIIDNYSTHVLPSLGFSFEELRKANPGLIMLAAPAFGATGSWSNFPGFGTNVDELCGHASLTGYEGGPPEQYNSVNLTDPLVGLYGALAVAVALRHRQLTGRGQFIDISHIEASATFLGEALMDYAVNGRIWPRIGNRHPEMAPHGLYRCSGEDEWLAIAVRSDAEFAQLCAALRGVIPAGDSRFATAAGRLEHQDELDALIERWTCQRDRREAAAQLQAMGVPAGPVLTPGEILSDPQFLDTGHFEMADRAHVGRHLYPAVPARFSRYAVGTRMPSPTLGEHNVQVLHGILGVPLEEMAELERDRVIGTEPAR